MRGWVCGVEVGGKLHGPEPRLLPAASLEKRARVSAERAPWPPFLHALRRGVHHWAPPSTVLITQGARAFVEHDWRGGCRTDMPLLPHSGPLQHRLPLLWSVAMSTSPASHVTTPTPSSTRVSAVSSAQSSKRASMTGLNLRDRAMKALDVGVQALATSGDGVDGEPLSSSSSSTYASSTASSSSAVRFGRQLKNKSASFVSLAAGALSGGPEEVGSSSSSTRSSHRRTLMTRSRQTSVSSSFLAEDRDAQYHKHNLIPLPPPGHVRPVLLPTYAVRTEEEDINIRVDGFVEVWPSSVGTSQRVFNQMVRQMANLPRLPRQQPTPASETSAAHQTPWKTSSSPTSTPTSPLHEDTDDAVFFPDLPYGVPRKASTSSDGDMQRDGIAERITQHAFTLGAPEKAIGKVLQSVGALPVEGKLDDRVEEEAEREGREEPPQGGSAEAPQSSRESPIGGSPFWSKRSREDVERLLHTLEHRLRSFWTYRKPHQQVVVEIVPVFRGEQAQRDQEWALDGYGQGEGDEAAAAPLLATTRITTDAHGLFSTELTLSQAKLEHYIRHYHSKSGKAHSDLMYLRVRACIPGEGEVTVRSQWQSMRVAHDSTSSVRVICDVDDTAKHTEVLGGARVVTRNVFARPFEEVHIPGVTQWFDRLCYDGCVDGFHFVTNAPAEMYGIVKAYLSSAQLPSGHLALKHYFSPTKSASWLQAYLQPAASRKRQNLQRCLDDFPLSKFIFVGDSGEMDLEIYSELASERPHQVKGIWIRDVGNVTSAAKSMSSTSFAPSIPSTIQPPPAAHLQVPGAGPRGPSNGSKGARAIARPSRDAISKAGGEAPTNEFEARLARALAILPSTTRLRFWSTGQDAMNESVEFVCQLKNRPPPHHADVM